MSLINEIREKQEQLILMINTTFDEIVKEVEAFQVSEHSEQETYEILYPLAHTAIFKGKKPIAVIFENEERITTSTWKVVMETILRDALKDPKMQDRMMNLRDKLLGRKRKRISDSNDGMRSPLQLTDKLFIETHYDTETLLNLLLDILEHIGYDFQNLKIAVRN